jgi:hypothetical protein
MREIVQLFGGQCGIRIGTEFFEQSLSEHYVSVDKSYNGFTDVMFKEIKSRLVPRVVAFDLDPAELERVSAGKLGGLFDNENDFITGSIGSGNNFATAYRQSGPELIDEIMDAVRKNLEPCDACQGFHMCHSISGGTGSGLGCLVLEQIKERWPELMIQTLSLIPSEDSSDSTLEPYNSMLCIDKLAESADMCVVLENEALYRQTLAVDHGRNRSALIDHSGSCSISECNRVAAAFLCDMTSCMRFGGGTEFIGMRRLATNLVPFRRVHFISATTSPRLGLATAIHTSSSTVHGIPNSLTRMHYQDQSISSLVGDLFHPRSALGVLSRCATGSGSKGMSSRSNSPYMSYGDRSRASFARSMGSSASSVQYRDGSRHLAIACIVRARDASILEIDHCLRGHSSHSSRQSGMHAHLHGQTLPDMHLIGACTQPSRRFNSNAVLLTNNTAIGAVMSRINDRASVMLARRAYTHHYEQSGMEISELNLASLELADLISEYQQLEASGMDDLAFDDGDGVEEEVELLLPSDKAHDNASGRVAAAFYE